MFKILFSSLACLTHASKMGNSIDNSTYSNIEAARTSQLDMLLEVDFNARTIMGSAVHTVDFIDRDDPDLSVWFDATGLNITSVELQNLRLESGWEDAVYHITTPNKKIGQALEVELDYDV